MSYVLHISAFDKEQPMGCGVQKPVWSRVETCIDRAFQYGGRTDLHVGKMGADELGREVFMYNRWISMDSLPGKFRLIYEPGTEVEEKSKMREWWEPGDAPFRGTELFGDDEWDARTVCTDVAIAKEIFKNVFEHGELTKEYFNQLRSVWDRKPR